MIEHGYFTTKHAVAKVPDYRIEADSIDIYPGDKYIAHNVRLMAKNTVYVQGFPSEEAIQPVHTDSKSDV